MENNQAAELSLRTIVQQLRVPELNYSPQNSPDQQKLISRFVDGFRISPSSCNEQTVLKRVKQELDGVPLPGEFLNSAFLSDRLFDVWIRKANVDEGLTAILSKWRFPFFARLSSDEECRVLPKWFELLDSIDRFSTTWSGDNARSRKLVIDLFTEIELGLFSAAPLSQEVLETIYQRWHTFFIQQDKRKQKVISRLIEVENKNASAFYGKAKAAHELNRLFEGRMLPESLQTFLSTLWRDILGQCYAEFNEVHNKEAERFNNLFVSIFCQKGKGAAKHAPDLVDELSNFINHFTLNIDDAIWAELESDIVKLLQGQPVKELVYEEVQIKEEISIFSADKANLNIGDCFIDGNNQRITVAAIFMDAGQVLLTNDLGIKVGMLPIGLFQERLNRGELKGLQFGKRFSDIYQHTLQGLERIVYNQKAARAKAALKAKQEAQRLLEEKEKANLAAKRKASEIAEKAKNMRVKREEQEALKKKEEYLALLAKLNLGGWISVKQEDEVVRYKLAVKFAATSRYIFVDRLGLKKLEFKEEELINKLIQGVISILNDGADFDANLERVVSRLRIAKR